MYKTVYRSHNTIDNKRQRKEEKCMKARYTTKCIQAKKRGDNNNTLPLEPAISGID